MKTAKSASQMENEKVIEAATNKSKLARFASSRGIQLKTAEKAAEPAPLGEPAPAPSEKTQA